MAVAEVTKIKQNARQQVDLPHVRWRSAIIQIEKRAFVKASSPF
jgi:hypothetical protein